MSYYCNKSTIPTLRTPAHLNPVPGISQGGLFGASSKNQTGTHSDTSFAEATGDTFRKKGERPDECARAADSCRSSQQNFSNPGVSRSEKKECYLKAANNLSSFVLALNTHSSEKTSRQDGATFSEISTCKRWCQSSPADAGPAAESADEASSRMRSLWPLHNLTNLWVDCPLRRLPLYKGQHLLRSKLKYSAKSSHRSAGRAFALAGFS